MMAYRNRPYGDIEGGGVIVAMVVVLVLTIMAAGFGLARVFPAGSCTVAADR